MRDGKKYAAESIGTFGLVFAGTGAIIINDVSGGAVTNVGIGLTFGMIVLAMIYAVGEWAPRSVASPPESLLGRSSRWKRFLPARSVAHR
jgi:glycerol uptake facilitator-like aquaporin